MGKMQIILDTDIGDDIDDAFALALAASLSQLEIIGVTTVFKHTVARGQMVRKLLETMGKSWVPVLAGRSLPFQEPIHYFAKDDRTQKEAVVPCQYDASYQAYSLDSGDAVDFIIEQADRLAGQLVLVPIGPLTNIASAIQKAPGSMKKIQKIVLMGGDTDPTHAEWNIACDPEAAAIVFQSGIKIDMVGLNVTMQCYLDKTYLESLSQSQMPVSRLLSEWLGRWHAYFHHEKSVMHDPLAVATLIDNVCGFQKMHVKVDLDQIRGATLIKTEPFAGSSSINVAISVDPPRFNQLLRRQVAY